MKDVSPPRSMHRVINQSCHLDDPEIFDGAHVSVQVVGRRLQEEKVLALAEYIGGAIRGETVSSS